MKAKVAQFAKNVAVGVLTDPNFWNIVFEKFTDHRSVLKQDGPSNPTCMQSGDTIVDISEAS